MKFSILLPVLLAFSVSFTSNAQNLVPNPSMESNTACPDATNYYVDLVTSWQSLSGHGGTADYFNICGSAQHDWTNFSDNNVVPPNSGNGYIGMGTYDDLGQREYAEAQLTAPLVAGETYSVSAWVYGARGDFSSTVYTDNIGIYLTATNPSVSGCGMCVGVYNVTPAVSSSVTTQNAWTQITGTYVATGGEQYIVLGNFASNASTTVTTNGAPAMGGNSGYTYFDDVEVTLVNPLPATLISFTSECIDQDEREIRWTSVSEHNVCNYTIQQLEGSSWEDVYTTDAAGSTSQTTYYSAVLNDLARETYLRLKMTDCDGEVRYSKQISSHCSSSNNNASIETVVGDKNVFGIVRNLNPQEPYTISVYSNLGQVVIQEEITGTDVYVIRDLTAGTYHVSVQSRGSIPDNANNIIHIR